MTSRRRPKYSFFLLVLVGGVGNFYTQITDFANIYELRPWQGVRVFWPRAEINPSHLIRLEKRFFFDTDVILRFRVFQAF